MFLFSVLLLVMLKNENKNRCCVRHCYCSVVKLHCFQTVVNINCVLYIIATQLYQRCSTYAKEQLLYPRSDYSTLH